jgi:hypothetical protein
MYKLKNGKINIAEKGVYFFAILLKKYLAGSRK